MKVLTLFRALNSIWLFFSPSVPLFLCQLSRFVPLSFCISVPGVSLWIFVTLFPYFKIPPETVPDSNSKTEILFSHIIQKKSKKKFWEEKQTTSVAVAAKRRLFPSTFFGVSNSFLKETKKNGKKIFCLVFSILKWNKLCGNYISWASAFFLWKIMQILILKVFFSSSFSLHPFIVNIESCSQYDTWGFSANKNSCQHCYFFCCLIRISNKNSLGKKLK